MQGTPASSHWSATGLVVSEVDEAHMMSILSLLMSCVATSDARFGFDWLSRLRIWTLYFSPATMMPSPSALLTPSATHFEGSPNAAIGPVSGVIMPILMGRPAARPVWNIHGDAMAVAAPAVASFSSLRRFPSTPRFDLIPLFFLITRHLPNALEPIP